MSGMVTMLKKLVPKEMASYARCWIQFFRNKEVLVKTQKHYKEIQGSILNKEKITIASYVVFDSTFCADHLMNYWISSERFSPKIVVIPDVSRGRDAMLRQYERTKSFFVDKYGSEYVVDGYLVDEDRYIDVSEDFDMAYMANPYDSMVNYVHSISYLSTKKILPFMLNYCYQTAYYSYNYIMQRLETSLCWKVFSETTYTKKAFRKYELVHGKNAVLSGYAKMDSLAACKKESRDKKRIILAPHHTINADVLPLSNFLSYYSLIPKLPDLYPDVQFIFRPHPLLFTNMVNEGFWTQKQVDEYLDTLRTKGIEYSFKGDYMQLFMNSDALIQDCASFLVEYLFTGNPCCFVSKKNNKQFFNSFGKKCLSQYYHAWSEQDILSFIDDVISDKRKTTVMPKWFKKNVAVNYPHASKFIYDHLLDPIK